MHCVALELKKQPVRGVLIKSREKRPCRNVVSIKMQSTLLRTPLKGYLWELGDYF